MKNRHYTNYAPARPSGVNEFNRLFAAVRSSTSVIVLLKPLKSNLVFARNYRRKGWRAHE